MIDIAKLVIGGVILAGLMRQDIEPVLLFTIGGVVSISAIAAGLVLYISKESDGRYWQRWEGNYDASTQTIWGTRKYSDGSPDSFTFTRYTGVSQQAAPAASSGSSGSSAPSSRAFVVTVWYTSSGTRLSSVYTVEASSKDEAEREAERQWKTQFGWNQALQFQEAIANW